jgi:hypothetical protein
MKAVELLTSEELARHATEYHKLESEMVKAEHGLRTAASSWAQLAIEMGHALIKIRATIGHGRWQEWIENNARRSYRTCRRYVEMAESYDAADEVTRVSLLENESIRGFLDSIKEPTLKGSIQASEPPWSVQYDRSERLAVSFERHPFTLWPSEVQADWKKRWEPIVKQAWPQARLE